MALTEINQLAQDIFAWCERKGWNKNVSFEKFMMNLHSEISEAWEEYRKGNLVGEVYYRDDGKPEGIPIEIADLIIRVLHMAAYYGWDLTWLIQHKMMYNETRPYRHGDKVA